jgi:hypothetical protein
MPARRHRLPPEPDGATRFLAEPFSFEEFGAAL